MTVLVTGASGHVGLNLIKALLARNYRVRALIHDSLLPVTSPEVETVRGNVCDLESITSACKGVETVYHLAARISIGGDSWASLEKINVTGTRNVVQACLISGVKRLVHFSSIHAIMQEPSDIPVDESRSLVSSKQHPCYDLSKAAGEMEIGKGIEQGLDAVVISPTAIIGPNDFQSSFFGRAFLSMANGEFPALIGGGFDWVDVRDVADGAIMAAEKASSGSKYLLSGHWATVVDLGRVISEFTGTPCPKFTCPIWLASGVAPLAERVARLTRQKPLFTRDALRALRTCNRVISHEKATRELGYNPRPLSQTVEDTLLWYRENGKLHKRLEPGSERTNNI